MSPRPVVQPIAFRRIAAAFRGQALQLKRIAREPEIVKYVSSKLNNGGMSDRLSISHATPRSHLRLGSPIPAGRTA